MNRNLLFLCLILLVFIFGCKSKPSGKDIERKILLEYVCAEKAKVNSLEIVSTSPTTSLFGYKGYEYVVSGEIEWPTGCTEFGTSLPSGYREKFDNKRVVLIKGEDGWQ